MRTSAWPSWTKWAIYLVVLFFTIDFVMGLGLSVILLLTYALLYVGLGLQRLFILFEEREDAHCRPWSRAPPRAAARRVAGRRMRLAKIIRRRSTKRTRERGDAVPDVWPRRKRSQTEIKFRHVAPRATRLFALIAVALLAGHRIGEADNPGPLQWGFDAPELDHEVYEDELDKLDGAAAQADYGWVEAGFEADWTGAMLPAEQAGRAMYDHGFLQTHEGQMDIADVDDADLLGMLGGAIPSTARRAWYDVPDDHLLREGPLTQEEEEVVIGARAEAVKLPEDLFEQLQAKDRAEAENAYVKWKDVLDKAQANRRVRFGQSEPCRRAARNGESKQEDARTMDEPVIEEDLEREVVMSDVAEEKSAEATSADLVTDGVRGHSDVETPHRRRARGRRQRGARRVEIWTLNSSGKPQLEGALKKANEKKGAVVAVLNQEHHQTHDRVSDLQASARKYGWQVAAVGAVSGRGEGPSAGVSINTPKHVSAGLQEGEKLDASPCDSPGRVAALWLQTVVPGGVLALSVYFYHSEKGSHRNVTLLCRALEAAHVARSPWLIAADCQEEPDDFLKWAAGPIQRAGGRIVSAAEPTHYPASGAAKNLDFFIVSDKLCPYVEAARVVDEVAAAPHRAVAIVFKPPAKPQLQWQLKAPRAFPRTRPISCQREPVAPVSAVDALDRAVTSDDKSQAASLAWRELIAAMEIELCGLTDRFAGDSPDPKFCGRAAGARYTRVPIMPPRAAGMWGEVDLKTHAMIWAENRLVEMARLSNIAVATIMGKENKEIGECDMIETVKRGGAKAKNDKGEGSGLEDRQWTQWQRLTKQFTTAHCPIGEALSYDVRWAAVVKHVKLTGDNPAVAGRATAAAAAWARQMIVRQKRIHRKARAKGWNNWLQEEMRKGAGGAHAFAKRTVVNPDTLIEIKSVRTAAPCDVVEADFAKWDSIWTRLRDLSSAPWRGGGSSDDPCSRLPPLDVKTLRKSSRSFRITALGLDRIGPWHYDWVSDALLHQLVRFLHALENFGIWPNDLMEAVIHLIPKASGGRRPIGVLVSLMRVWERARRPLVQRWREACPRSYQWMTKGRGAGRAVWAQTVMEEAARQMGLATATVLVDLMKAFEQIILAEVWSAGVRHGFPTQLLRLGLELCTARRRLVYRGAYSEGHADTLSAILAGSGFATDFMFLMLIGPLDELVGRHQALKIFVIADDIKLGVTGPGHKVPSDMEAAARDCIELLEKGLHMQVSRDVGDQSGKTVAMGSSREVRGRLAPKMKRLGVGTVRRVRNLGVDFSLGAGLGKRAVQLGRWATAQARAARARRLGPKLGSKIISTSAVPSVTYGASTSGMTDGLLAALRSLVAWAGGKMQWRSTTARLIMDGSDPGMRVVIQPIIDWAEAWWDGTVGHEEMTAAWLHAIKTVGIAARPNVVIAGGAGTFVASLRRLGWRTPSPDSVITAKGEILFFGDGKPPEAAHAVDPRSLRRWLTDEYEAVVLARSRLATEINDVSGYGGYGREREGGKGAGGIYYGSTEFERKSAGIWRRPRFDMIEGMMVPWLWPMARVARAARRRGRHAAAASLRACVEGGWWTQARLASVGAVDNPICACGERVGTLWHRLGRCKLTGELRTEKCPSQVLRTGSAHVWDPLYSRAVPARPKIPPPPAQRVWWERRTRDADLLATGRVYTDGAAQGWYWRAVRAGYAAVCIDEKGDTQWVLKGVCGEPHASIARAELRAVLETLAVAAPPLTIYSDSAFVVDGFAKGKSWCTRAGGEAADLWRLAWHRMEDIGGGVDIKKVKAHATWIDVLRGRISRADREGNTAADVAAKEALAEAKRASSADSVNSYLAKAVLWARWMLDFATGWTPDTGEPDEGDAGQDDAPQRASEQAPRNTLAHEVWRNAREEVCRRCGRSSSTAAPTSSFRREACRGSAAGRLLAQHTKNRNEIWNRHYHSRVSLMSRGYSRESRGAVPRSMIDEDRLGELVADGELRAFRTHLGLPHEGVQEEAARGAAADTKREAQRDVQDAARSVKQRVGDIEKNLAAAASASSASGMRTMAARSKRSRQGDRDEEEEEVATLRRRTEVAATGEVSGTGSGEEEREVAASADAEAGVSREAPEDVEMSGTGTDASGHNLLQAGPMVFCTRCAGYALDRVGARLQSACVPSTSRATKTRVDRMRRGLHPITGDSII